MLVYVYQWGLMVPLPPPAVISIPRVHLLLLIHREPSHTLQSISDALYNWFLLTMYACTIVLHHVIQYSLVSMRLILINRHSSAILPIRRWGLSLSPLLSPLASFFSSSCVWLFSLFFLFRNGLTDFKKCSKAFLIEGVSYWRDTSW